ncbi:MAG: family 1 glycosylhydrolase [Candidatus Dojkabacteria bacterium]|nr:family 1 glycosylhydrolase [Candidatus Dojkabacteria bacterium]
MSSKVDKRSFIFWPLTKFLDYTFNTYFVSKTKKHLVFLGLNYYYLVYGRFSRFINLIKILFFGSEPDPFSSRHLEDPDIIGTSDMGWYLYPKGMYERVMFYHKKYKLPIMITEHGLADKEDRIRLEYTKQSLEYLHQAITDGAEVLGYMHWSLLDNFEWDKGYWPKFGLVEVDIKTGERRVRESAKKIGEIYKNNYIE